MSILMSYHPLVLQEESEVLFEVVLISFVSFKRVEAQKGPGTSSYCIINSYKTNHLCGYWPPGAFISLQEALIKNLPWYSKTKDDKPLQKANAT